MQDTQQPDGPKRIITNFKSISFAAILLLATPHLLATPAASAPGDDCDIIVERPAVPHKGLEPRFGSAYDSACAATEDSHDHVYTRPRSQQHMLLATGFDFETVETFELPPGTYTLHVQLRFTLMDQRTEWGIIHASADCEIRGAPGGISSKISVTNGGGGTAVDGGYEGALNPTGFFPGRHTATVIGVVVADDDTLPVLRCSKGGHNDMHQYVQLEAAIAYPVDEHHQM